MDMLAQAGALLGLVMVGVGLFDLVVTTAAVSIAEGPVTARVAQLLWRGLLAADRRRDSHRLLAWGGPVILLSVILTWIGMLIVGWALLFGWPDALQTLQEQGASTDLSAQLDYASSLVLGRGSTLVGAAGAPWVTIERIAGLTGLLLLSLSIAYVLPVINAVVSKRRTASYISALGHTPDQLLDRAWNGVDFGMLRLHLIPLTDKLSEVAENHHAYPVVHYFHSIERHTALGPSVAVLDDTLTILECCEDDDRLEPSTVIPLRAAITEFLDTLERVFIEPAGEPGPTPDIEQLRGRGLPLLETQTCIDGFDRVAARRRMLRALLDHDGWTWDRLSQGRWEESAMLGRDDGPDDEPAEQTDDVEDEADEGRDEANPSRDQA